MNDEDDETFISSEESSSEYSEEEKAYIPNEKWKPQIFKDFKEDELFPKDQKLIKEIAQ